MPGRENQKRRILIVDDDIRATAIFAQMLREDGHEVTVAHDGDEGIELMRQSAIPDILVTDVRMPHVDGLAVARYARERSPTMPIFFVTGYPDQVSRRLKSLDPKPFVFVKPLDYVALATKISSMASSVESTRRGRS